MPPLFKFIDNHEVADSLLAGRVKFTPIRELNDPAELNPNFNQQAVVESLLRLRKDGYSDEDMFYLRRQGALLQKLLETPTPKLNSREEATRLIQSPLYDSMERLEDLLTEVAQAMAPKVGIFCLSNRFNSLPMWAHYANGAKGFAIEFKNLERVFQGDETGVLRQPRPVIYETEITGVTFDPVSHETLFFSKFLDWSYEQEVRVVLPLAECKQSISKDKPIYLFDLPPECVERIIFGWHMPENDQENIKQAIQQKYPNVKIGYARFARGQVHID